MSQHWEQVSPVRRQSLLPPALPPQSTATSLAGRENGNENNNDHDEDDVDTVSNLSDDEEARLIAELHQIRISIDDQTKNIDQCSNWRATIEEVAQELSLQLNQVYKRAEDAAEPVLIS